MTHCPSACMRALRAALGTAGLALACLLPAQAAESSSELSAAEQIVFNGPHLQNVRPPQSLHYRFQKSGPLEPGFEDEVQLALRPGPKGGCCSASGRFLSGERQLSLPEIEDARSNPVILYFLEHDVREMQRRTKGQSSYFRKRIRLAMVERASVADTVVRWGGAELPAREVSLTPYADDPLRARFERFAGKEYRFVLAPGVPGGVYQIRTRVPGARPADPPALEETMTLAEPGNGRPAASTQGNAR
ncbi:hypothetical protein [Caldimonas tepidiphila]|uniref:hypothetical protein n=1 Tax=Caldimonas tepidiphila TaxID=2315841 RepID=UPI000E5A7CE2|nr:hypothetical protein [Caldimonas tepidiphila]